MWNRSVNLLKLKFMFVFP